MIRKNPGDYVINGCFVPVAASQVCDHPDDATVESLTTQVANTWRSRIDTQDWPMKGDVVDFGSGPMVSRIDFNVWTPAEYPSGWIAENAGADGAWAAGLAVQAGDIRTHDGGNWLCLVSHTTQVDWTPGLVPTLWARIADATTGTPEWQVGVAYSVGDEVTYLGITYRCRQAHTSISTWFPPAVLALWLPL